MKITSIFHVPGCSGMFRNVPECSMFLVLSTPAKNAIVKAALNFRVRMFVKSAVIYCSIMLSRVKLTNAHTVRGRPTLKNNTECFRNGLVRELKEKQRKLSRHSMTSKTHGPHRRKGVDKTRNIPEHPGTSRNIPEHEKIKIIFMKKKN